MKECYLSSLSPMNTSRVLHSKKMWGFLESVVSIHYMCWLLSNVNVFSNNLTEYNHWNIHRNEYGFLKKNLKFCCQIDSVCNVTNERTLFQEMVRDTQEETLRTRKHLVPLICQWDHTTSLSVLVPATISVKIFAINQDNLATAVATTRPPHRKTNTKSSFQLGTYL